MFVGCQAKAQSEVVVVLVLSVSDSSRCRFRNVRMGTMFEDWVIGVRSLCEQTMSCCVVVVFVLEVVAVLDSAISRVDCDCDSEPIATLLSIS